MTREEAKKYYLLKNKWDTINREELYDLIDEIYDNFELSSSLKSSIFFYKFFFYCFINTFWT